MNESVVNEMNGRRSE